MSEMTGGSEPVHVDARLLLVVSRPVFDPQGHIDAAFLVEHVFEHARRGNDLVVDRPAVSGLSLVFHGRRDRHRAADLGRVDAGLAVEGDSGFAVRQRNLSVLVAGCGRQRYREQRRYRRPSGMTEKTAHILFV